MKTLTTLCLLVFAVAGMAQNPNFIAAVEKNKLAIDTAHTKETFQRLANTMERIAGVEKKEWLAQYYAAYCNAMAGLFDTDNDRKDAIYEKALVYQAKADSLNPNSSEVYTLKGLIYQLQLQVNPMLRGAKYGPMAAAMFDKAVELDPSNPRPYYLKGQGLFYTPSMFGGGKDKALPLLQQSVDKYAAFKPASTIMPTWGEYRAKQLLQECKK